MNKIFYISGMHCPSCNILIRETIDGIEHIDFVELTSSGELTCFCHDEMAIPAMKEAICACGYEVSEQSVEHTKNQFNRKELGMLIVAGVVLRRLLTTIDISGYAETLGTTGTLGYGEMFLLGVIASLSTCLALVGGFILMRGSLQGGSRESFRDALRHQGLFQLGRLGGYALGGALLGMIGSAIMFSPSVNGVINLLVSLLLLIMGWNMLGRFRVSLPAWGGGNGLMNLLKRFSQKKRGGIVVGALTFFLPCGFTQVAQINAMSTGSSVEGALLLFVFALGTLPVLLALGLTGNRFQTNQMSLGYKLLGVFLIVLSLFLIQNSTRLLGR